MQWTANYQLQLLNETIQRARHERNKLRHTERAVSSRLVKKRIFLDQKNFDIPASRRPRKAKTPMKGEFLTKRRREEENELTPVSVTKSAKRKKVVEKVPQSPKPENVIRIDMAEERPQPLSEKKPQMAWDYQRVGSPSVRDEVKLTKGLPDKQLKLERSNTVPCFNRTNDWPKAIWGGNDEHPN